MNIDVFNQISPYYFSHISYDTLRLYYPIPHLVTITFLENVYPYLHNKKRTHYCEFPYIVLCNSISYSLSNACAKSAMISSTFSIPMDTRNCSGFTPAVNCSSGLNWACVVLAG